MIERYSTSEMTATWSEHRKLAVWKEVETLVVEAWVELGIAPPEAASAAREAPEVDVGAWKEREATTHHDVAAFVDLLSDAVGTNGEWIHFGLTSSDVLDTATGVLLRESGQLLLAAISEMFEVTKARALEHRDTIMVRDDRFKLVLRDNGQGPNEFYSYARDPRELRNEYENLNFITVRDRMAKLVNSWVETYSR